MVDVLDSDVVRITSHDRGYLIRNPGGRVGSHLEKGIPYEHKLLGDIFNRHLTGVAFDVGAHVGNHTLYLAAVCGLSVHAWEPHDKSRFMLEANLTLNPGLEVTVHDWAAGAEDNRGRFTKGMWLAFDPSRSGEVLQLERGDIPIHRIDDHLNVTDLTVAKIDVEGAEADVLVGMAGHLERCRPIVYVETHRKTDDRKIGDVLGPLSYERTGRIVMGSVMVRWEHVAK